MKIGQLLRHLLLCDSRCCGGGNTNKPPPRTRETFIKGLGLFLVALLALQYVTNMFFSSRYPLQRVLSSTIKISNSSTILQRALVHMSDTFLGPRHVSRLPHHFTAVQVTAEPALQHSIEPNHSSIIRNNTKSSVTSPVVGKVTKFQDNKTFTFTKIRLKVNQVKNIVEKYKVNKTQKENLDQFVKREIKKTWFQEEAPIPPVVEDIHQSAVKEDFNHDITMAQKPIPPLVEDSQRSAVKDIINLENTEIPPSLLNVTDNTTSGYCPSKPPGLVGEVAVTFDMPTLTELESELPEVEKGGRWHPKSCKPRHRVAIIIPYRDREEHLRIFLAHIHPFLQKQLIEYGIYVIEQNPGTQFNRAMLMNIGFVEALKLHLYDCAIFHDVDLLPEDDRNLYTCPTLPRHMSAAVDTFGYQLPYTGIFGGVVAISVKHFKMVNGFSNMYFGWGAEDDDMFNSFDYLKTGMMRFKSDGLNSLKYTQRWVQQRRLYTWVMVNINESEVLSLFPIEQRTPVFLDQAEGAGNEARKRMKEKEERMKYGGYEKEMQEMNKVSRFDADGNDDGEEILGGFTRVSYDDLRKAKLGAQELRWMKMMRSQKLSESKNNTKNIYLQKVY